MSSDDSSDLSQGSDVKTLESSSTASSGSRSGSASNREDSAGVVDEDEIEYESFNLDASVAPISLAELNDDDVDLWFIRVPSHEILLDGIVGKSVTVDELAEGKESQTERIGSFKGSYHFRDCGIASTKHLRAAFVVNNGNSDKNPHIQVGMYFAQTSKSLYLRYV